MAGRILVVILISVGLTSGNLAATLDGTVRDQQGRPVVGATVGIATAAPLVGRGIFCPSCYLDCQKRTTTDADGRFKIEHLSDSLRFQILFAAPGLTTQITDLVDPRSGPLQVSLTATPDVPDEQKVTGKVVNQHGLPIQGALLKAVGAKRGDERWGGLVKEVEPVVSDAAGRFSLILPEDFDGIDIEVHADGYAGTRTDLVNRGAVDQTIVVPLGATVRGRLMRHGEAVADAPIAVVQTDRSSDNFFIKAVSRQTDLQGRFEISNLPAAQTYAVFSPVGEGTNPSGKVIATRKFEMPSDGETFDLGEIEFIEDLSLTGQIVPAAGEELPANAKIALSRDPAWDLIELTPDAEGKFSIDGLPPETYEIRIIAEGYEVDGSRLELQRLDTNSIGLHLVESQTNVTVPLHRIALRERRRDASDVDVEGGSQALSGIVVDPKGRPVAGVTVSALLANSYQTLTWRPGRSKPWTETDAAGRFEIRDLPDAPIQLMVRRKSPQGGRVLFPAIAWPSMNETNLRIIYDPAMER